MTEVLTKRQYVRKWEWECACVKFNKSWITKTSVAVHTFKNNFQFGQAEVATTYMRQLFQLLSNSKTVSLSAAVSCHCGVWLMQPAPPHWSLVPSQPAARNHIHRALLSLAHNFMTEFNHIHSLQCRLYQMHNYFKYIPNEKKVFGKHIAGLNHHLFALLTETFRHTGGSLGNSNVIFHADRLVYMTISWHDLLTFNTTILISVTVLIKEILIRAVILIPVNAINQSCIEGDDTLCHNY